VISREGGDFSMDLIFAGLVRRFGKENVIDYPPREKNRQGKPELVGDDERDYGAERRSLCYVDGCENLREWTRPEIMQLWGDIDTVFLDETDESYQHWMELFGLYSGAVRTVVIAGHDSFRGNPREVIKRFGGRCTLFIDDWKQEYDSLPSTHLINLSCNYDHLWDVQKRDIYLSDKKHDICFIGYNSNPARKVVINHVRERWGHLNNHIIFEERHNQFDQFVRHDEMFKLMAKSKICLNLPGASTGGRALRYYETPYVGSWMISQWFPARLLYPMPCDVFEPGDLNKLDSCIEDALENPEKREERAKKLHNHCMEYHTVDARMDYVFRVLNGETTKEIIWSSDG